MSITHAFRAIPPLDETARVKLAVSQATAPDTLSRLAQDPSVTVRAAVALNPAAPGAADQGLAGDDDARLRLLLTRKLLAALPNLSRADQARLRDQTLHVLSMLVQDTAVRVRTMIAEVLAEMPDAPRTLILALAQDAAIPVSTPVLRLSPLLSDADLLRLLQGPPHAAAATAIAFRANLSAQVADAIAASDDAGAIRALLANPSAAIRETTLDALIDRAAGNPDWHAPLVHRPALPDHAARALAEIVASHMLEALAGRTDLRAETVTALRARLAARLAQNSTALPGDTGLLDQARQLEARGALDEAVLLDASARGETRYMAVILAVAAGLTVATVDRAAAMRSPKALVSLVWKAGFSMRVAHAVQTLLGHVAPGAILHAGPDAGFPLSVEEMAWQIEFLTTHSR